MLVKIEKLDNQGRGICYINNKITFIPNTLPEELVDIKITKETSKYNEGIVVSYQEISPKRVETICPFYQKCGGCHLMHMSYQETINFKKEKLVNILTKYAKFTPNISFVPSPKTLYYRNKITLKIKDNDYGYYSPNSHNFIKVDKCLLVKEEINNFLPIIPKFNIIDGEITIRSNYNQELLISITTNNKITLPEELSNYKVVGVILNNELIYGENHFIDIINHKLFEISYNSFFQINNYITSIIFNDIKKEVPKHSKVLDLYCGVGTLGIASYNENEKLYGIEIIPNAILNAIKNSKINKIDNVSYHLGDVAKIINKINDNIDVVIIDPPRKGIDKKTISIILKILPKKIIYMSCDPITLARDLNILKDKYDLEKITGYDMFPYTYHVECVCIIKLR